MAPVRGLVEALARNGRFAVGDGILDVALALERMYVLDGGNLPEVEHQRIRFLRTDAAGRERIKESVRESHDIARSSLFRLLREGLPEGWNELATAGS